MEFDGILGLALLAGGRWVWKQMKKKNKQRESTDATRFKNRSVSRETNKGFSKELQNLEGTKKKLANIFQDLGGGLSEIGKEFVAELNGESKKAEINKTEEKRVRAKEKVRLERQIENTASGGGNKMQRLDLQDSQQVFTTKNKDEKLKEKQEIGAYSIKNRNRNRNRIKLEFSKKAVTNGIIMAEVLGKPKAL
ncbi:MAG: hypothetical protein ACLKAK_10685 [Alkaliphilus sp.]